MQVHEDLLPVLAILVVIFSIIAVDIVIINEPLRAVTVLPISLVLMIWGFAVLKLRRG